MNGFCFYWGAKRPAPRTMTKAPAGGERQRPAVVVVRSVPNAPADKRSPLPRFITTPQGA